MTAADITRVLVEGHALGFADEIVVAVAASHLHHCMACEVTA